MRFVIVTLFLACCLFTARAEAPRALGWDALEKGYAAKPGETESLIPFTVTNRSKETVEVRSAATSCHCTHVVFPRTPWRIAPGASDTMIVHTDLRSRRGGLNKTIYLDTTAGEEILAVHIEVPPPPAIQREMNLQVAQADRQAVLHGDCATCHVTPAIGKHGADLFATACLVCHGATTRAEMVPDLFKPKVARDAAYWNKWIRERGEKVLMPDWDHAHGGPLEEAQIESLVAFLTANLPTKPVEH
jgi:cytochrome c553